MPEALLAPPRKTVPAPGIDAGANESASDTADSPNGSTRTEYPRTAGATSAWIEPPLPNGVKRTYLTAGGSAAVAVAFLVFLAILLAYFSSATSWAPW